MTHERTRRLIAELRTYAAAGLTIKQAAQKAGVTYHTAAMHARTQEINFLRQTGAQAKSQRNAEVARRYLAGEAQVDLAKVFGITRERVRQICDKAGCVSERKRHADFVAVVVGTVIRKNLTLGEASEMFDIPYATAYKYCRDNGVVPNRLSSEEIEDLNLLAKQVEDGDSIRNAADRNHNKAERLRRFLKRNGIEARGRSRHDDFSARKQLITTWRAQGHSWPTCAEMLAKHDGRPIGHQGLLMWCRRHMPELFISNEVAA